MAFCWSAARRCVSERRVRVYTDNVPVLIAYIDKDERYRFTTWRWGRVVVGLMAVGLLIKAMMAVW